MQVRYPYQQYDARPPAPVIEVTFSAAVEVGERRELRRKALIDSGADCTCLPQRVIDELGLKPVDEITVAGATCSATARVYWTRVQIEGVGDFTVRAIGLPRSDALLGRDIINRWRLLLDGPGRASEINSVGP